MFNILMIIVGGLGSLLVLQYFFMGIRYKKYGKQKKAISDELIELLKE